MPSFDLVSQIDIGELKNVINQAEREISGRYDFKGSDTKIELKDVVIELRAEDEYKMKAALDILRTKMGKRDIGMNAITPGEIIPSGNRLYKQILSINQGIDKEQSKKINKIIKSSGYKVSSTTLDDKVRIVSKKIDDLQQVFQMLKDHSDVKIELQIENMKR